MSDTRSAGSAGPAGPADPHGTDTGHDYDGIREFDNRLPNWWLATLFSTMIFGYGYFLFYHVLDGGSALESYNADVAAWNARQLAIPVDDGEILALSKTPAMEDTAKALFVTNCAACHLSGEGKIGPNLTDDFWLHGDRPSEIYETISKGVPSKGMLTWGPILGAEKVKLLAAYVVTLKGKNLPGKAPEGIPTKH